MIARIRAAAAWIRLELWTVQRPPAQRLPWQTPTRWDPCPITAHPSRATARLQTTCPWPGITRIWGAQQRLRDGTEPQPMIRDSQVSTRGKNSALLSAKPTRMVYFLLILFRVIVSKLSWRTKRHHHHSGYKNTSVGWGCLLKSIDGISITLNADLHRNSRRRHDDVVFVQMNLPKWKSVCDYEDLGDPV